MQEYSQDLQHQFPLTNQGEESMWSAFQNILTFIALAFFAGSIHTLWSIFVNHWFSISSSIVNSPPYLNSYPINYSISTLIVSTPLFIFLFLATNKKYILNPELKKSKSKKFLNYATLIVTFIILIVRSISAINTALNNSFTINFGLSLSVTFVIIGTIFGYYLYEVRLEKQVLKFSKYLIGSIVLLLIAIATIFIGLPLRQKNNPRTTTPTINTTPTPKAQLTNVQKPSLATATNLPSKTQTIEGIDITITNAKIYESGNQKYLELSTTAAANIECPLTNGSVCGVSWLGMQATDGNGFKLEPYNNSTDPNIMKDTILQNGEKVKGKYFFKVTDLTDKYFATYKTSSGEKSDSIEIQVNTIVNIND